MKIDPKLVQAWSDEWFKDQSMPAGSERQYIAQRAADHALEEAAEKLSQQHQWLTNVAAANLVRAMKGEQ